MYISIHALREEGDSPDRPEEKPVSVISIHALREEGDVVNVFTELPIFDFYPRPPRGGRPMPTTRAGWMPHFYPRPPRGGRQSARQTWTTQGQFLSTPSARRATAAPRPLARIPQISIHALREEGDVRPVKVSGAGHANFYPRPPRGGRPSYTLTAHDS